MSPAEGSTQGGRRAGPAGLDLTRAAPLEKTCRGARPAVKSGQSCQSGQRVLKEWSKSGQVIKSGQKLSKVVKVIKSGQKLSKVVKEWSKSGQMRCPWSRPAAGGNSA